jgi:glycosyltransferase involved in cell wall biosynthesis
MDNFSTPETAEVVASFNDPRIKYYRATERLSMSDNWELGLSYATGEYIFVLGDDDALMPDGLEIAFNFITVSSPRFLNELIGCVNLYHIDPSDLLVLADLQKLRKQLADFWLSVPTPALETFYAGDVGKAHCTLISSEMKDQPLPANEQAFVDELTASINQEVNQAKALHYLLAASLYYSTDRLPMSADISHLPNWFLSDYQKLAKV